MIYFNTTTKNTMKKPTIRFCGSPDSKPEEWLRISHLTEQPGPGTAYRVTIEDITQAKALEVAPAPAKCAENRPIYTVEALAEFAENQGISRPAIQFQPSFEYPWKLWFAEAHVGFKTFEDLVQYVRDYPKPDKIKKLYEDLRDAERNLAEIRAEIAKEEAGK